ncbi:MAG TPA: hypothetical protein VGN83_20655 [Falsiroseomonas sp.]|jgi:hypothetical protein|nr:hypothetical protein [Falsiroseomonas sp.]
MTAWTVAILSSRETPATLAATLSATIQAIGVHAAVIDLVVNGNPGLAAAMSERLDTLPLAAAPGATVRVWELPLGDKAHAWNCYVHQIWPGAELAVFLDGYVAPHPDALRLLDEGLALTPGAIAATGVPTVGRSAGKTRARLLREGGTHGNLHALRGETMRRFHAAGFRMPLGLYRTDALLNSTMALNLDPSSHDWDPRRVLVHPDASWSLRPLAWHRPADLLTQLRRILRQHRGEVEKLAFAHHLMTLRARPEHLPPTATGLVEAWLRSAPARARQALRFRPMLQMAVRRMLAAPHDWSRAEDPPRLLATRGPGARSASLAGGGTRPEPGLVAQDDVATG